MPIPPEQFPEETPLTLTGPDRDRFLADTTHPPEPPEALRKLMRGEEQHGTDTR